MVQQEDVVADAKVDDAEADGGPTCQDCEHGAAERLHLAPDKSVSRQ